MTLRICDLYCCAGGSAWGMHLARPDAEITGVDILPQPHYPFKFVQADVLHLPFDLSAFDFIWASPPCQRYSESTREDCRANWPDLIEPTRKILQATGKPYVIENVEMARHLLINPIKLCGSMFGLKIFRHRYFEIGNANWFLTPVCKHDFEPILITGMGSTPKKSTSKRYKSPIAEKRAAIGIDWMTTAEITEAIPPVFAEYILRSINLTAVAAEKGTPHV